ncbi:Protein crumbs 3 [Liparis tanakae]|uniref:Protein crumbs 3 n=1 Tax=Liparis tanakae TaxID=230148 RepID=A0A4Z2HWY2_9TELE|nr:Protein crumbs 3 [Liparis tanakae]
MEALFHTTSSSTTSSSSRLLGGLLCLSGLNWVLLRLYTKECLSALLLQVDNCAQGPNIAAIVAPTVTLGVLAIVLAVLGWLLCVVKKRRQTEGTYRPSSEEQSGACGMAAPDALKLPKEERLI